VSNENEQEGKLKSTQDLVLICKKKILIDDETAPKSPYMQIYRDSLGKTMLTFLNAYNNSIYIFDYQSGTFIKKISYKKEGPNGILGMAGYYIKNLDSIYVYNRPLVELDLTDNIGYIKNRISLRGKDVKWALSYPQYFFNTVCPIFEINRHLILTGLCPFSIDKSSINKFLFTACIDIENNKLEYHHLYPSEIYGNNANWEDPLFMQVFPAYSPSGDLIYSFPESHKLYISHWNEDIYYKTVYGGSNVAGTIRSINWNYHSARTPRELIYNHYLQQDLYAAILYDPWRKVYYRFMQKGIKDCTTHSQLTEKSIIVILMNEQFNYLGETLIGTGEKWNWENSFVTKEGLNIEYIDSNDTAEACMNFRIFSIKKI